MDNTSNNTLAPTHYWLSLVQRFRVTTWGQVNAGDMIYYRVSRQHPVPSGEYAAGPFFVVDPQTRRLRNNQGVEWFLASGITPLVLDPFTMLSATLPQQEPSS